MLDCPYLQKPTVSEHTPEIYITYYDITFFYRFFYHNLNINISFINIVFLNINRERITVNAVLKKNLQYIDLSNKVGLVLVGIDKKKGITITYFVIP